MPHTTIQIRCAHEGDATAIADIYAPYVRETAISFEIEPPTAETMRKRIVNTIATYPWLVAHSGSEIAGYAYAGKHRERPAYRWSVDVTVYVSREMHRQGVGRALYVPLLEVLRVQGFRSAFADITLPNAGSTRLHEAMGFNHIGIHRDAGFKLGSWRDIGYWRLGLADGAAPHCEPHPFSVFRETAGFASATRKRLSAQDPPPV